MNHIKAERSFEKDVKRWKKKVSGLQEELQEVLEIYFEKGYIPDSYNPHLLDNPSLPYYGDMEFHLLDDLLVVYVEISKRNSIRLIRLGTHAELFHPTTSNENSLN